jgi:hypothetical protein
LFHPQPGFHPGGILSREAADKSRTVSNASYFCHNKLFQIEHKEKTITDQEKMQPAWILSRRTKFKLNNILK